MKVFEIMERGIFHCNGVYLIGAVLVHFLDPFSIPNSNKGVTGREIGIRAARNIPRQSTSQIRYLGLYLSKQVVNHGRITVIVNVSIVELNLTLLVIICN